MKTIFRVLLIVILSGIGSQSIVYSQDYSSKVDTTFDNYMNKAWQEIREAEISDSLQLIYAKEFYQYFQKNPETATALKAIRGSFMMWGNTKTSDYVDDVLQSLDYDSRVWGNIIFTFRNLYSQEEHRDLMQYLSKNLTDPRGKSEAILFLLRTELREEEPNEEFTIDLARQLVEINATDFHVEQGLGYLHEFESLNIGQKAPVFTARTIDGREISIADYEGQFVLLEFWATWCGPCLPEIPHLKSLYKKYQDDGFTVIGISLDRNKETLINYIEENEMQWPQVYVEDGWESDLPRLFNVSGIPNMYLLDTEGKIIGKNIRGEEMVSTIDKLLTEHKN